MGRVIGVDFGLARIGLAVSDPDRRIASPLGTYHRITPEKDAEFFRRLARDHEVGLFVVGLPLHLSGDESPLSKEARRFGLWLAEQTQVPVRFFDERFTTREATQALADAGLRSKRLRRRVDKVAAQLLLAAYLETEEKSTQRSVDHE